MLEYLTYKKIKKHQAEKRAREALASPVLSEEDENFLQRVVSEEGTPPALPERPVILNPEVGNSTGNDSQVMSREPELNSKHRRSNDRRSHDRRSSGRRSSDKDRRHDRDSDKEKKKQNLFSIFRSKSKKGLSPKGDVSPGEAMREEDDITRVLNDLNLSAVNNRAFSLSKESQDLVKKFTVVLKDLVNGVPTAYDDLVNLLEDSQGTLAKSYEHLPSFLQKLITTLPTKLTSTLAPELLAVAAEAQGLEAGAAAAAAGAGGFMGAAKGFLKPNSLKDLVTKPGAVAGMLKAIMNTLKLRWPAFMGTNVLLSLGLFVLLFVFWYCHKRGREVRLEKERMVDSNGRIVELEDDVMLDEQPSSSGVRRTPSHRRERERLEDSPRDHHTDRRHERRSAERVSRSEPHSESRRERSREHSREQERRR